MVLTLQDAAARHRAPTTWGPGDGRVWRARLAADVEAGLAGLWDRAVRTALPGPTAQPDPTRQAGRHAAVPGLALACVGSLARREAGPASDLDLVLLTDGTVDDDVLAALTHELWYPLWDAGARLDHSVRTIARCRTVASGDLAAALGLLDLRHVAGDEALTAACAAALLTDWRRATRKRLGELAQSSSSRSELAGELFTLIEPDLKEARGGLRDVGLVRSLAASSLADRPHGDFDDAVETLLDTRDALALTTRRATNRLTMTTQDAVAQVLAVPGPEPRDAMLARLYGAGRVVAAALDATMRSALRAARPARKVTTLLVRGRRSAPVLTVLDDGVARLTDEVVLADGARPQTDSLLPLRVALASARHHLPVAVVTRRSLGRCPAPSAPWSRVSALPGRPTAGPGEAVPGSAGGPSALDLLVELLGTGQELIRVWEDLDLAGLPVRWLPGWSDVRNRPQRNPVHLWTVDRHMVRAVSLLPALLGEEDRSGPGTEGPGTAGGSGWAGGPGRALGRGGARGPGVQVGTPVPPPLRAVRLDRLGLSPLDAAQRRTLLVATLLHDLGKVAGGGDHSAEGATRVPAVLETLGVEGAQAEDVVTLVRHHLLLAEATNRPPGEAAVAEAARTALAGRRELLAMLRLLTEADARAAGPRAWTSWRAGVVDQVTAALASSWPPSSSASARTSCT